MSSTQDPLDTLRQAIRSKSKISYSNDAGPCASLANATHIVFSPSVSILKSTPTRLRKPGTTSSDPQTSPGDFIQLDAVFLAWALREAPGADYTRQVRENGVRVGFVSVTERKGLADWLEGRTNNYNRIAPLASDSTTPPGTPPSQRAALPSTSGHAGGAVTSPSKRRYIVDNADSEVVKKIKLGEIELSDRNTVLRGAKLNNFNNVRTMYAEKLKKLKESSKAPALPPVAAAKMDPKAQARKARNMYPIIMISSSPTSLITMYNVKHFLQDAVFEDPVVARDRATKEGNTKPEDLIAIYRKRTHIDSSGQEREIQARYFVVDSVEALGKFGTDAWDRVVAVLTTGQAWQFKPYKWNEPRTLFHHVKGFYVAWTRDPPNLRIKDWNVTELKIDPSMRHVDKAVVASFWKTLDTWTVHNRPWLMKS